MPDSYDGPFSLLRMFWGNLAARPLRCALSIVAIAIQVVLVLMIVGLTSGVVAEWGKRVEGVGADLLVQPPNSSIFFAFSSAVMAESLGEQIANLPDVDESAPTLILSDPKSLIIVYGIDYKRFNALSQGFIFRAGRPFQAPDEASPTTSSPKPATSKSATPSPSSIIPSPFPASSPTAKARVSSSL
ncbi:MAG TPA: ABC transporter permease [Candidatus Sulfotelmatobacter sp.]|nr:ABC transporter permease [Candidatus Sulfotelmatobacter sp.]